MTSRPAARRAEPIALTCELCAAAMLTDGAGVAEAHCRLRKAAHATVRAHPGR
jgi:hypothetical protein